MRILIIIGILIIMFVYYLQTRINTINTYTHMYGIICECEHDCDNCLVDYCKRKNLTRWWRDSEIELPKEDGMYLVEGYGYSDDTMYTVRYRYDITLKRWRSVDRPLKKIILWSKIKEDLLPKEIVSKRLNDYNYANEFIKEENNGKGH